MRPVTSLAGDRQATAGGRHAAIVTARRVRPAAIFRPGPVTPALAVWLLLIYATLIVLRLPAAVTKGRFWAEEGAVYFLNALNQPWPDALFAVHSGYLNLSASLATLLAAHLVPLEDAPFVTTGFALLIQLCPPILLLTGAIPWLRDGRAMAVALLLILGSDYSAELWLNAITSQFHLGLCVALILALSPVAGWIGFFRLGLLVLAPLSGPVSMLLAPLFLVRAYLDRSLPRAAQGCVLGLATAVQLLMVLLYAEPGRDIGIGPRLLTLVVYVKHLLIPLIGPDLTVRLAGNLTEQVLAGQPMWGPLAITAAVAAAFTLAAWSTRDSTVRWLLAGGTIIMVVSYSAALGRHVDLLNVLFGGRYAYIPSVLFALTLVGISQTAIPPLRRLATVMVAWVILASAQSYFWVSPEFTRGPSWSSEVAKWRSNPAYSIQLWPDDPNWRFWFGEPPRRGN